MSDQAYSDWIQMRVLDPLPKHLLVPQQSRVGMMRPKRIFPFVLTFLDLQLVKRFTWATLFQFIDQSSSDDAIDESVNILGLLFAVCDQMNMIHHDDIGENQEPSGFSGFVQGVACQFCESQCPENWKPVLRHGREIESRGIFRNLEHSDWRRSLRNSL